MLVAEGRRAWGVEISRPDSCRPTPRTLNPRMVRRDPVSICRRLPRSGTGLAPSPRAATITPKTQFVIDQFHAHRAKSCGQQTIGGRRRAAALDVAKDRHARFETRQFLKLLRKARRVTAGMPRREHGQFRFWRAGVRFWFWRSLCASAAAAKAAASSCRHCAFRHGDNAEICSMFAAQPESPEAISVTS